MHEWRTPAQAWDYDCLLTTVKNGGGIVMVLTAISWISAEPIATLKERISGEEYKEVLSDRVHSMMHTLFPQDTEFSQRKLHLSCSWSSSIKNKCARGGVPRGGGSAVTLGGSWIDRSTPNERPVDAWPGGVPKFGIPGQGSWSTGTRDNSTGGEKGYRRFSSELDNGGKRLHFLDETSKALLLSASWDLIKPAQDVWPP
ncbi:DDE_3 domain-containing protein [Trichonephila clavipes]|nr:DDE_3 domain-containing protein [Trichonephila clavipes]